MRKQILILLLPLILACAATAATVSMPAGGAATVPVIPAVSAIAPGLTQSQVLTFPTTFRGMAAEYKAAESAYLSGISAVMAIPAPERTFANTVKALDEADARYSEALSGASFMEAVSPDRKVQRMASAIDRRVSNLGIKLADRDDIYQAYKDVASNGEELTGEDKKLLKETLRGYERRGMGLPQERRDRMNAIRKRLSDLSQAFNNNLKGDGGGIEVDATRLGGLPESYVKARATTPDGKVKIGLDYPSYGPFMASPRIPTSGEICSSSTTIAPRTRTSRSSARSSKLRQELADPQIPLLCALRDRGPHGEDPRDRFGFYGRLKALLAPGVRAEEERLLEEARRDRPETQSIQAWDRDYYKTKLKKRLYDFDGEELRPYFPVDTVIEGTLRIYQNLLGVTFEGEARAGLGPWRAPLRDHRRRHRSKHRPLLPRPLPADAQVWSHGGLHDHPGSGASPTAPTASRSRRWSATSRRRRRPSRRSSPTVRSRLSSMSSAT